MGFLTPIGKLKISIIKSGGLATNKLHGTDFLHTCQLQGLGIPELYPDRELIF